MINVDMNNQQKEFYKAELALKYGKKYIQEFPLKFKEGVKVKLTVES